MMPGRSLSLAPERTTAAGGGGANRAVSPAAFRKGAKKNRRIRFSLSIAVAVLYAT